MSDLSRFDLKRSAIGAMAVFLVGVGLAAPGRAGMVEDAQKMQKILRAGTCVYVGGGPLHGRLCLVRENIGNPKYVHFHLTFDGRVDYFNEQHSGGQSRFQVTPVRRSARIYREAKPGQIVQVKVQACVRKFLASSDCTAWAVLKVMM